MNTQHKYAKILAFVGLTGSGKTTAVEYFTEKGFPKVYFGGIILEAMKDAGIEITPDNERVFREEFRKKHGKDAVANKIVGQIRNLIDAGQYHIIADGIYTWSEYKVIKHAFPGELTVVAIVTPKRLRYRRLAERAVRPLTEEQARERDWSEIENLEKGGPIAIADYYVVNNTTEEDFYEQLSDIARDIEF